MTQDWDSARACFEYGVDVDNRRVFLFGEINESTIANSIKAIYLLDSQHKSKAIELFVGSVGGDEYDMLALYDVLNSITAPIHTVALGKCMSAAPLLVAAGEKGCRYSMPGCPWMAADWSLFQQTSHTPRC